MEEEGETIYSFVIGRLRDLLAEQRVYLKALAHLVDELVTKLKEMEDLLEYAHVRKDKRTSAIIELADQLIDSIEAYVFRAANKTKGIRERLLLSGCIGIKERLLRPKVCMAIKNITIKINDFINSQSKDVDAASLDSRRPYKLQDLSGFKENDFVGRKEEINNLVKYLVDHEEIRVISIHGMGGLGKTTLARKVYKDEKVLSHFQRFAFVCVSEQCRADEILKHILQQLDFSREEEIKKMPEEDVIEKLHRVQGEKKCLIIIDDIWSVADWESLNRGLHDGSTGTKVLLTTRIKDVADKGFYYPLKCLSEEECWELFQKTIGTVSDPKIEKRREELGREMIAWCRGNPLAVLVLRGVLVTKHSLREWERFYESKTWGREGGEVYQKFNDEVGQELFFSYKELPYHLRPCFLYLATFPEDEKIEVETLLMLWDAEGMILSKDKEVGDTNMDVAERYLGELVGRCMIEAELDDGEVYPNARRRYKICRLHDLMRKLCLSIVKKEDFLEVRDYRGRKGKVVVVNSTSPRNDTKIIPRQVFYTNGDIDIVVEDKHYATSHVRSLMLMDDGSWIEKLLGFNLGKEKVKLFKLKKWNMLRVLRIYNTIIGEVEFTKDLIHLRYLSFKWCTMAWPQSSIYDLIYLQTLDMHCYYVGEVKIPALALRKLKGLKHLFLPDMDYYKVTPKGSRLRLDGLTKLETLENFDSKKCEMEDVIHITNLRRLQGNMCISSEDDGKKMKEIMNKLDPSRHLSLAIELVNPEVEMYSDIMGGQLPQSCEEILNELAIKGVKGKLLPEFSTFCRLTWLKLEEFEVEEDPMPTLEKLSNLKHLRLVDGKLKGKEMTCSTNGFPQLKYLFFLRIEDWEKWRVEEGAMPNLIALYIWNCSKLEMIPNQLKFITTLQIIYFENMPEEFKMMIPDELKVRARFI